MPSLNIMLEFDLGSNSLVAWGKPGLGMEGSHRVVLFLKRRLRIVACLLRNIARDGFTLA